MIVSAINSIRTTAPITKTAKTAKVRKRAEADRDSAAAAPMDDAAEDRAGAPKSPAAMSSSAVQAALMNLKPG